MFRRRNSPAFVTRPGGKRSSADSGRVKKYKQIFASPRTKITRVRRSSTEWETSEKINSISRHVGGELWLEYGATFLHFHFRTFQRVAFREQKADLIASDYAVSILHYFWLFFLFFIRLLNPNLFFCFQMFIGVWNTIFFLN